MPGPWSPCILGSHPRQHRPLQDHGSETSLYRVQHSEDRRATSNLQSMLRDALRPPI